jgi:hypothetical protein
MRDAAISDFRGSRSQQLDTLVARWLAAPIPAKHSAADDHIPRRAVALDCRGHIRRVRIAHEPAQQFPAIV